MLQCSYALHNTISYQKVLENTNICSSESLPVKPFTDNPKKRVEVLGKVYP